MTFSDTVLMKENTILKVVLKWLPLTLLFAPITQYIAEKWKLLGWHWHKLSLFLTKAFLWAPGTVSSHTFLWSISVQCCFNSIHRWKTTLRKFSATANHRYLLLIKESLIPRVFLGLIHFHKCTQKSLCP